MFAWGKFRSYNIGQSNFFYPERYLIVMQLKVGTKTITQMMWIIWVLGLIFVGYSASQSYSYTIWFAPVWIFLPLLFINVEQVCIYLNRASKLANDTKQYNKVTSVDNYEKFQTSTSEDSCTICLSILEIGEKVRRLPCHHIYHKECIDTYFDSQLLSSHDTDSLRSPLCAVCRQEII